MSLINAYGVEDYMNREKAKFDKYVEGTQFIIVDFFVWT